MTATIIDHRADLVCPGTFKVATILTTTDDALNEGRVRVEMRCVDCPFETTVNMPTSLDPRTGWHPRPYAPLHLILRAAAQAGQYGHARTPRGFYISVLQDITSPGDLYWAREALGDKVRGLPDATVIAAVRLLHRYQRYCHWATEIEPRWETVSETRWMDNSIDAHQVAHDGRTRTIQTTAPHGDLC